MSFDRALFERALRETRDGELGEPLTHLALTGSTNDDAAEAAKAGAPHGAVFIADQQTQGRGRQGKRWDGAPGEDLLCSVLLRPRLAPSVVSQLTLAVGLALRDAVERWIHSPDAAHGAHPVGAGFKPTGVSPADPPGDPGNPVGARFKPALTGVSSADPPGDPGTHPLTRTGIDALRWNPVGAGFKPALTRTPPVVQIKWPNDVWIEGRKVAGVLVESQLRGAELASAVVGVGLNLRRAPLPPELSGATSVAHFTSAPPSRELALAGFLVELERRVSQLTLAGLTSILPELRRHDGLLGRRIQVEGRVAIGRGIATDGALLIEREDGALTRVRSGSVEVLDEVAHSATDVRLTAKPPK
ncbi:MAG: biotin--[acetyl-CoA-carboxylase] ligase [Polyangiaceae bacterium]|nr:biotin--[acetyl-CoA-carboxylase] ligase [Polyangiaceae bacterium]MCW5789596.1 biotin--[acetyl-CoA-carboxylase] ligase [Polyangiaceae bacterium]